MGEEGEEKKSFKQKIIAFLLAKLKINEKWDMIRNAGSGYGTILTGLGTALTGAGCLWMKIKGHDLDWLLTHVETLRNDNCALMIGTGLGLVFLRRSNKKLEEKIDKLNSSS